LNHVNNRRPSRFLGVGSALAISATLAACGGNSPTDVDGICAAIVDLFPTPVSDATSPFNGIDDADLLVTFATGFQFSFYGDPYSGVYLNTNGGMTFGTGESEYDVAATDVLYPGIAVFWGDLDAGDDAVAAARANQMTYEACEDRFIVRYTQLQDNDNDTWNNTATVTLEESGRITIQYGTVLSQDILVGVFDGTHTDNDYVAVQNSYSGYSTSGTGTILFDDWGPGPTHTGQLSNRTIVFNP
jgi:hypothetical protein